MSKYRTLVVDDTEIIRRILIHILGQTEFEVVGEAVCGSDAVQKFEELSPDLVLMDIIMPGVDGIEAARQILQRDPAARVVMCTAVGEETVLQRAMGVGASHFIMKPFVAGDVLQVLRGLVAQDREEGA